MSSLDISSVCVDPIEQFGLWFREAQATDLELPEAVTLATVGADGMPSARVVLCKRFDAQGFVFYTNYKSAKAQELESSGRAALVFYWEPLHRQVRIQGSVERQSPEESQAYFETRPRGSQIGAWASPQSQVVADRKHLEQAFEECRQRFAEGRIPCPPFWGGYRIKPEMIEFWQGRANRFHDRIRYSSGTDGWEIERLAP